MTKYVFIYLSLCSVPSLSHLLVKTHASELLVGLIYWQDIFILFYVWIFFLTTHCAIFFIYVEFIFWKRPIKHILLCQKLILGLN